MLYDDLCNLSQRLANASIRDYSRSNGRSREAARRNMAFFSVGLKLLLPKEGQVCNGTDCSEQSSSEIAPYFNSGDQSRYSFQVPPEVEDDVEKEMSLITARPGFVRSPIFGYSQDYSQFLPRGHYTRSERLKNYFLATMWYGRMGFLLKGCDKS